MDPVTSQIILGVVANALSAVLENRWSDATALTIDDAIETAKEDFSEIGEISEQVGEGELRIFLESPEAFAGIRMLFVALTHDSTETSTVRSEFVAAFERAVPGGDFAKGNQLFTSLLIGAERVLTAAAREGDPGASEALQSIRFRKLTEELDGLRSSLEDIRQVSPSAAEDYLAWEKLFRGQVAARHATITPPSLDSSEPVPVNAIYVAPTFQRGKDSIDSEHLIGNLDRTVVLGDPGAGKSTFALKLAYDLARDKASLPGGSLTPFVVNLREYGAEKQASHVSIIEWIEKTANSDYSAAPPEGAVTYLLSAGRAAVIFDGLDELLDTSYRRTVTADIETFAARFLVAPILVTSRRVGYAQAPLDPRRFDAFMLAELSEEGMKRYVHIWFGLRRELSEGEAEQMVVEFLQDSAEAADDLRRNMLMLGLLCNLYRGSGYIPRHRPTVYEKCAVMLFERWDRGRKITVQLGFERHLRPAMQHLAFWIYSNPSLKKGVTEAKLVSTTTEYLLDHRFEDEDEAREEARRFVEFCRGRAWVFTDTGTTPAGEGLYQFTHRTFLEFFAAEHLVRTRSTPKALLEVLLSRIAAGEWDVVAQLAFQLQDKNIAGAGDELLEGLLQREHLDGSRDAILSFAARSLAFLVPRRETCRNVGRAVTNRTCAWLLADQAQDEISVDPPTEGHSALIAVDRENFDPVSSALRDETIAFAGTTPSSKAAEVFLEVGANADMAARGQRDSGGRWNEVRREAFDLAWPSLGHHASKSVAVAYDGFAFGELDLDGAATGHPPEMLFQPRAFRLYGNYTRPSIIELLLEGQVLGATRVNGSPLGTEEELRQLGVILAQAKPPWDRRERLHEGLSRLFGPPIEPVDSHLEGDALFGAFAALATTLERGYWVGEIGRMLHGIESAGGWIGALAPWIEHKFGNAQYSFPALPVSDEMLDAISGWSIGHWSATIDPRHFRDKVESGEPPPIPAYSQLPPRSMR